MSFPSLLVLAVALGLDAFAVAIVVGLSELPVSPRRIFRLSLHFGLFQALMPALGWLAGSAVRSVVAPVDHWMAFALLAFVGGKMIAGAMGETSSDREQRDATRGWCLVALSVATSIDAFAAGLSLAVLGAAVVVPVVVIAVVIGVVAALLTLAGMILGRRIGLLWGRRVELVGGLLLVGLGCEIVVEHLSAG